MNDSNRIFKTWLLWPTVVMLLAFFLIPSLDIIRSSIFDPTLTGAHFERFFTRTVYLKVFLRTVQISALVAIICALVGYPVAYFISQCSRQNQFLLMFFIFIPLWMSVLIRSYAWMVVLGREGIINTALITMGVIDQPLKLLFTTGAVHVAMVQILLPIQIISCFSAMSEIDMDLIRAARVMGARPLQAFRRVFLPLSLDGTVTGALIVFMLSMGFFITPALVGGRQDIMLANLIDFHVQRLNWGFASTIAMVLLVGTICSILIVRHISNLILRRVRGG
jgi:ABC-type spermidine/putrescine transport system permease subunit I